MLPELFCPFPTPTLHGLMRTGSRIALTIDDPAGFVAALDRSPWLPRADRLTRVP